jgi:hypothetical protein
MNEPVLPAAERELEAALAALVPARGGVEFHRIAFEAGRRAGARTASRWRLATAATGAAVLVLGVMLSTGGPSEPGRGTGPAPRTWNSGLADKGVPDTDREAPIRSASPVSEADAMLRLAHGAIEEDDLGEETMGQRPLTSIERAGSARRASRGARSGLFSMLGGG